MLYKAHLKNKSHDRYALPARTARLRIGLLGGSFNPAHPGHLHISQQALKSLRLHQVWWLLSPQNPLKSACEMAPIHQRLRHARAIVESSHGRIKIAAIETRLETCYTIDTLKMLRQVYSKCRFVWIMGADNLNQVAEWRKWKDIFNTVTIAVFARPGYVSCAVTSRAASFFSPFQIPYKRAGILLNHTPPAWLFNPVSRHTASATALRRARHNKSPVAGQGIL